MSTKYFYRDKELHHPYTIYTTEFDKLFPNEKGIRSGTFCKWVGRCEGILYPVQRMISYKSRPSLHECNDRCLNGKHNGVCECSCRGVNHGLGRFLNIEQSTN